MLLRTAPWTRHRWVINFGRESLQDIEQNSEDAQGSKLSASIQASEAILQNIGYQVLYIG